MMSLILKRARDHEQPALVLDAWQMALCISIQGHSDPDAHVQAFTCKFRLITGRWGLEDSLKAVSQAGQACHVTC